MKEEIEINPWVILLVALALATGGWIYYRHQQDETQRQNEAFIRGNMEVERKLKDQMDRIKYR